MPQSYLLVYREPYRADDSRTILFREKRFVVSVGSAEDPSEVRERELSKDAIKDGDRVHSRELITWGPQPHSMLNPHDRAAYI